MEWLQEHMRKRLAEAEAESTVVSLGRQASQDDHLGLRAVELAERAMNHIRNAEQQAADRYARAEALARHAIDELRKAEERVRAAEYARRAIEAQFEQAAARLGEMEIQLERAEANAAAAAETKIRAAQEQARAADKRAADAESALKRIETMLDTILMEKNLSPHRRAA